MSPSSDPKPVRTHHTKGDNSNHTTSNRRIAGNAGSEGKAEQPYALLVRPWPTHYGSTSHTVKAESQEVPTQNLTPMERWSQEQSHESPWNDIVAYSTTTETTEPSGTVGGEKRNDQTGSWSVQTQDGSMYEQY
jgi:hypothetical protein